MEDEASFVLETRTRSLLVKRERVTKGKPGPADFALIRPSTRRLCGLPFFSVLYSARFREVLL